MPEEIGAAPKGGADAREPEDPLRRLRDSARRRDELVGAIARELRDPLDAARAEVRSLLASGVAGDVRAHVLELERRLAAIRDLQHDLAELHDLATGRARLRRDPVDLSTVAAEVADELERRCPVDVEREIPGFPVTVLADGDRLRFAAVELAAEVAAGASGGQTLVVRLDALPGGGRLAFAIRGGAAARPPLSGSVALALARDVVELHGGVLDAAEGRADLWLVEEAAPGAMHPTPASTGRPRILVVEDDDATREALTEALSDAYDVEPAVDGVEGVEAARTRRPDVVVMDLVLPRLDGFGALEALRSDPSTADVPVILVSGRSDDLTRAQSLDLGAIDFLQKPYSERELRARIDRTLRLARRQSQLQALADTDALTGLANRRAFRARLAHEVKRARRYGTPLACVMVDLDHLKPLNDRHGHAAGDRAIAGLAGVLRSELRETDFGARYGGDEFVALLPHTSAAEGCALAERIAERLRHTGVDVGGAQVPLHASFGVAELGGGAADEAAEALVRNADRALYDAKGAGRDRVAMHAPDRGR